MAQPLYLPLHFAYNNAPGIHANTNRITYTVPVGRIAKIQSLVLSYMEAGAPAFNNCNIIFSINAVQQYLLVNIGIVSYNVVTITDIDLSAADVVTINTVQTVAGGTFFGINMHIREYQ